MYSSYLHVCGELRAILSSMPCSTCCRLLSNVDWRKTNKQIAPRYGAGWVKLEVEPGPAARTVKPFHALRSCGLVKLSNSRGILIKFRRIATRSTGIITSLLPTHTTPRLIPFTSDETTSNTTKTHRHLTLPSHRCPRPYVLSSKPTTTKLPWPCPAHIPRARRARHRFSIWLSKESLQTRPHSISGRSNCKTLLYLSPPPRYALGSYRT